MKFTFSWLMKLGLQRDADISENKELEALQGLGGPMTRARTKKAKEALKQLLTSIHEDELKIEDLEPKVIICIKADEDP